MTDMVAITRDSFEGVQEKLTAQAELFGFESGILSFDNRPEGLLIIVKVTDQNNQEAKIGLQLRVTWGDSIPKDMLEQLVYEVLATPGTLRTQPEPQVHVMVVGVTQDDNLPGGFNSFGGNSTVH